MFTYFTEDVWTKAALFFRLKQRQQDEEVRSKAHMKQRMDTIITLKSDIAANRVTAVHYSCLQPVGN